MSMTVSPLDQIDPKEQLRSKVLYIRPDYAPHYVIIISFEVLVLYAARELEGVQWWSTFAGAFAVLLTCAWFALRHKIQVSLSISDEDFRVSRVLSVVLPALSLSFHLARLKLDPLQFWLSYALTFVQILAFLALSNHHTLETRRSGDGGRVNIPQLLVICGSLLVMCHSCMASLAARTYISSAPPELFVDYHQGGLLSPPPASGKALPEPPPPPTWSREHLEIERRIRGILDDESNLFALNRTLGDQLGQQGIHRYHLDSARRQLSNLKVLAATGIALWLVFLVFTRLVLQEYSSSRL